MQPGQDAAEEDGCSVDAIDGNKGCGCRGDAAGVLDWACFVEGGRADMESVRPGTFDAARVVGGCLEENMYNAGFIVG
ncbi:MAG: hypothetical protein CMP47_13035 [Rickettsiales bacterium]|nr:hypothetical protein [Rickettsiales bacterium]